MAYLGNNPKFISQTYRPQSADPSNPTEGMVFYADGTSRTEGLWQYTNGSWQQVGGANGGLDVMFQLNANESLTDWSTGDNATFLGGGTLAGTFTKETSSPLNGIASYKYTQAASSLDDYLASASQPVPIKFRGQYCTFVFNYKYDGANSDIKFIVYDVTNSAKLTTDSQNLLPVPASGTGTYKINVFVPLTCANIRVGFQVAAVNNTKIFEFDDIVASADTTMYAEVNTITDWASYTPTLTGFGSATNINFKYRQVGSNYEIFGSFTTGTTAATEARVSLPNSYTVDSAVITVSQAVGKWWRVNTGAAADFSVSAFAGLSYLNLSKLSAGILSKINADNAGSSEQQIFWATVPITQLNASNPQIISAVESFSTDSATLAYSNSLTLSTLADAAVGSFITFRYASTSSNTRTQSSSAPTQTTSNMNTNGIQLFTRAYNATSTDASPAVVAIQIGKNMKGVSLDIYKSTSKVTGGSLDLAGTTAKYGAVYSYNESTGILVVDAGVDLTTNSTSANFQFEDASSQTNGYLVINASKSPALAGVPASMPRIAYISDQKSSGTNGGSTSAATFNTRTLNTLVDNFNIVSSLSSNQFTLPAGTYSFRAFGTVYANIGSHRIRIRNITDSTTAVLGRTGYCTLSTVDNVSSLEGEVTISSAKTFELQHYTASAVATNGFGLSAATGENELYAQVSITKIR